MLYYKVLDDRIYDYDFKPSTLGANAVDLRACIDVPVHINPQTQIMIPTGIAIEIPLDTAGLIMPRSGLGSEGLILANVIGNIDPDYRGQVMVNLRNRGNKPLYVAPMDRIAQLMVVPVESPKLWIEAENLTETERGENGFGHSGIK